MPGLRPRPLGTERGGLKQIMTAHRTELRHWKPVAPIPATARSPLNLSATKGRHLGSNGFELAPELAYFLISLREISGPSPRFTLGDNLPTGAISLHASS